jgi:hypothetical protein
LILVLLSMLVLSVLAATIVFTARSETLASYNFKLDTQADYLAKAGIQRAVNWFRSTHYKAVPHSTTTNTIYAVSSTGTPWNLWTSNTSPVTCISGCSTNNSGVQLIGYGSGSSNYPNINNTEATPRAVTAAFASDLNSSANTRVSGDANNSGFFNINAILLNYQTVMVGAPPAGSLVPVETWLITSKATWTGGSSMTGTVATAEEQAIIQPIYVPTWGNALYGFCSVDMWGSAGTCTDAFNSALGAYGGGNTSVASGGCDSTTATNVIASGAGVGSNGYVSLASNVTVAGNVTIGSNPTGAGSCCTAPPSGSTTCGSGQCCFQGSAASVLGEVINGPHKDPPAVPTFRTTPAAFPPGAPSYSSLKGSDVQILPLSVTTWPSLATFPNTSYTPPLTAGPPFGPCMDTSCTGAVDHPYEIGDITMKGGSPTLRLIGGPDPFHPVYYDINTFSQNQGSVQVSGYVVLNVKSSFSIGGNGISNGITSSIPPECVQIQYAGTDPVTINGNGAVSAVINAPNADVTMGGGGSGGYMVGSIQAKNVNVHGGYPVHYDVQLSRVGGVMGVPVTTAYNRKKM